MKAVIVSSSYTNIDRITLLKECYEEKGYETTVLLTDFMHASKTYVNDRKEGYMYIKTKPYYKNISVQRLYSHHRFAEDALRELKKMEIDLLHVLVPANSLARIARKYKELHQNVKLYLDIIDLWPESMPINYLKNTFPFRIWKNLRDKNLENAERVYCECNLFRRVLGKEDDNRYKVLYWAKTTEPIISHPKLTNDAIHLCYLGSINNIIDIDYIVKLCDEISRRKEVVIHIIGQGEKKEELLQKLSEIDVEIVYHGAIYDEIKKQEIYDQCHFGLNVMKPSVCVGLTMKSLDYFQAGLPIINTIAGDTAEVVAMRGIGFNGYEQFLEKMDEFCETDYLEMRNKVRKTYMELFSKEAFKKQVLL